MAMCLPYQQHRNKKRSGQLWYSVQTAAHFRGRDLLSKVIICGNNPQNISGQRRQAERKHRGLTIRRLHRCEVRRFV